MNPQAIGVAVLFSLVSVIWAIAGIAAELAKIAAAMKERNTIECKKAGINRYTL